MRAALALAVLALAVARAPAAGNSARLKIIVNPEAKLEAVDREVLREVFLKKTARWPGGDAARPIDLARKFDERDRFTMQVIRKTPAQLHAYWNQQIFSGKGVPPPEADSVTDAIAFVVATPGAVAYIPVDADPGAAKVVPLR